MVWNDEAEYRKRYPDPEDRLPDEVLGGYYAEGLPDEAYFVWHIMRRRDGGYRVVIDFFLPWDAVDLGFDHAWRSKDQAVLWAKFAVRALASVERDFFRAHGVDPGVIEVVQAAMDYGVHDATQLRPGAGPSDHASSN